MVRAGPVMVLVVRECAGLATLTLGKPAAPGLIATGGLLWAPQEAGAGCDSCTLLEAGLSLHL